MAVTRDMEATVEYDGEDFTVVLRWSNYGYRQEHSIYVDEADLPREVVLDLKDTYTERHPNEEEPGDDSENNEA